MSFHRRSAAALVAIVGSLAMACSSPPPDVPLGPDGEPDPVLATGRDVFGRSCTSCHGAEGQGGRGERLNDGRALEAYPDVADMVAVVTEGKGQSMPAFADQLSAEKIDAVVRYVREVLN